MGNTFDDLGRLLRPAGDTECGGRPYRVASCQHAKRPAHHPFPIEKYRLDRMVVPHLAGYFRLEAPMFRHLPLRTIAILCGSATTGCVCGLLLAALIHSAVMAQQEPQPAAALPHARVFGSDAGMVLNFVKPDKTADFEAIVGRLREALQKSDRPERKQQAASWKVFRAVEPGANGSVLYVFDIDPAVKGADYTISTILAEAFPTEVQALYQQYADAYASGQNFVNLTLVAALGEER